MAYALLLALIAVPLIEIAVFIQVGSLIGLVPTLLLVLATAVAGTILLRAQGFRTVQSARATVEAGGFPARELFDGLCILFGGALLLTPGFFTDAVGLLLLLPPVRELMRAAAMRRVILHAARPGREGFGAGRGSEPGERDPAGFDAACPDGVAPGRSPWGRPGGPTIEGDYAEVDTAPPRRDRPDGPDDTPTDTPPAGPHRG
ncbi:MAG: FxsA family protein [Alphaproteobacteria bacterium]